MSLTDNRAENVMRKRLFIGLLVISIVFIFAVFVLAWYIVSRRSIIINQVILTAFIAAILLVLSLFSLGIVALVVSVWRRKTFKFMNNIIYSATNFLFPVALQLGKLLGFDEMKIKNSFVQVSNHMTRISNNQQYYQRIMILAPHCLQWVKCPHKITMDVNNCRDCGKCQIADLRRIAKEYQADLCIASGGTFARKAVKERKPQAIVAIACERDLTSGLQDVTQIPVIGIVNERPEGPCCNTRVDLQKVEGAIKYFRQEAE